MNPMINRCDRCNAAGKEAWFNEELFLGLIFCGHHTNQFRAALIGQGWRSSEVA
jgi:hypothetical protein